MELKKFAIGFLSAAFLLGAGTYAFAQTNEGGERFRSFDEMLPFMREMHPGFSRGELKDMYRACHGANSEARFGHMKNMNKF